MDDLGMELYNRAGFYIEYAIEGKYVDDSGKLRLTAKGQHIADNWKLIQNKLLSVTNNKYWN